MEKQSWRLIINAPAKGSWNMAVDEAILLSVSKQLQLPTLRLYAWQPYCLSLGHAQPVSDVDRKALDKAQWHLVRRPTGGKAILHADEITYAIIAPQINHLVHGSVVESYRRLSEALLESLKVIGLVAQSKPIEKRNDPKNPNPVCFESPSDYELTYDGKKIIGSAQARKSQGVLQHGALPLYGDITRIVQVLKFNNDDDRKIAKIRLQARAATLQSLLGKKIAWKNAASAFICGFESTLNITLKPMFLSKKEREKAKHLLKTKYANDDWTYRI